MYRRYTLLIATAALILGALPLRADEKAEALLKAVRKKMESLQTLSADLIVGQQVHRVGAKPNAAPDTPNPADWIEGALKMKRPNFAHVFLGKPLRQTFASDGTSFWTVIEDQYLKCAVDPAGKQLSVVPFGIFFDTGQIGKIQGAEATSPPRFADREKLDGVTYQVIEIVAQKPYRQTEKLYIGDDYLVHQVVDEIVTGENEMKRSLILRNIKTNANMTSAEFAFLPPKTAKPFAPTNTMEKLIGIGQDAPRFSLPTFGDMPFTLAEAEKNHKAILVFFWGVDFANMHEDLMRLQRLYDERKGKGLEVIAVNGFDEQETIRKYVVENRLTFPIGLAGKNGAREYTLDKLYGVTVYPTVYLIGADSKVLWGGVTFDEAAIRRALEREGVK